MPLRVVPIGLKQANALVEQYHRHHKPLRFHKFSIGCMDTDSGELVGAAICNKPVSRTADKYTLEVARLVTNGHKNACSMLYAACARVGKAMGYTHIWTYILQEETGVSLKAAGWQFERIAHPPKWHKSRHDTRQRTLDLSGRKQRWGKKL